MLNLWYDLYWYGATMTVGNHRFSVAAHTSLHNWLELLEALPKNFRGLPSLLVEGHFCWKLNTAALRDCRKRAGAFVLASMNCPLLQVYSEFFPDI